MADLKTFGAFTYKQNTRVGQRNILPSEMRRRLIGDDEINNAKIRNAYRAYNAVVSTLLGDGDTDDIQVAINTLNGTGEGGIILIRPGIYYPLTPLILYDNITLMGVDPLSTIIDFDRAGNCTNGCIQIIGENKTDDNTITVTNGDATVTGASTTFVDDGVSSGDIIIIWGARYFVASVASNTSLELTETYQGNTTSSLFYKIWSSKSNINIYNLQIINGSLADTVGSGIKVIYADNIDIQNNIITNHNTDGINVKTSFDVKIVNNNIKGSSDNGIYANQNVALLIDNNSVNNNTNNGIECASSIIEYNNFVNNNSCNANGLYGIQLNVSNNFTINNNFCGANNSHGVYLNGSSYNTVVNNICVGNGADGIHVTNQIGVNSEVNIVVGNTCKNNDDDGIELTAGSSNNNVCHNIVLENLGTDTVDSGTGNTVADNSP